MILYVKYFYILIVKRTNTMIILFRNVIKYQFFYIFRKVGEVAKHNHNSSSPRQFKTLEKHEKKNSLDHTHIFSQLSYTSILLIHIYYIIIHTSLKTRLVVYTAVFLFIPAFVTLPQLVQSHFSSYHQ